MTSLRRPERNPSFPFSGRVDKTERNIFILFFIKLKKTREELQRTRHELLQNAQTPKVSLTAQTILRKVENERDNGWSKKRRKFVDKICSKLFFSDHRSAFNDERTRFVARKIESKKLKRKIDSFSGKCFSSRFQIATDTNLKERARFEQRIEDLENEIRKVENRSKKVFSKSDEFFLFSDRSRSRRNYRRETFAHWTNQTTGDAAPRTIVHDLSVQPRTERSENGLGQTPFSLGRSWKFSSRKSTTTQLQTRRTSFARRENSSFRKTNSWEKKDSTRRVSSATKKTF